MIISATTRVGGSIGRWSGKRRTTSPIMLNAAFEDLGVDLRWFAFEPDDLGQAMAAVRALNFVGVAVTKPFKEQVASFVDALDPIAARIGAVNLVHNAEGHLTGYNSDWIGAAGALREKCSLEGTTVAVLGSGGAARAVVFGLVRSNCDVHVFARSQARGRALASDLGAAYGGQVPDAASVRPQILVNATSIGNDLGSDVPVPDSVFTTARVVMDIIARPGRSHLLERAAATGAEAIGGVRMLVLQAAFAVELLTGAKAPVQTMQDAVERAMAHASLRSDDDRSVGSRHAGHCPAPVGPAGAWPRTPASVPIRSAPYLWRLPAGRPPAQVRMGCAVDPLA
jgi:shikimate dehydrogenase